ncbi:Fc.00g089870.m01.CDS01 [Cosmosporella sp. VM-42]
MATNGSSQPTCQNCSTSTTPLWRRDEFGSVLCNACGLFLKLHGRPRPISLKTDVIKSRNRVKTMRPDLAPKKKQQQQAQNFNVATDANGVEIPGQNATAAQVAQAARRTSQKSNGHGDGSDSPISRTGTPSMYNHMPSFMVDDPYQSNVGGFGGGAADGRAPSPLNGDRNLDPPQTHEQLIAHNSSLKTRVSELEVINELFRGRLSQLEQQEAAARRGQEVAGVEQSQLRSQLEQSQENEAQLRAQLDDSHRRENSLKRRLDDLELELKALKEAKEALEAESERPMKKQRTDDGPAKPHEPIQEAPQVAPGEAKEAVRESVPATAEAAA